MQIYLLIIVCVSDKVRLIEILFQINVIFQLDFTRIIIGEISGGGAFVWIG